jgi:ABC-2 type transport system ATP-binding protein
MTAALCLRYVRVRFGGTVAVDGVSLDVAAGEIVALLGPNGSGKSTTLAVAAGLLDPEAGATFAAGIARSADPHGYARGVGFVPQEPALYDELSAIDNLRFFGKLYGLRGRDLQTRIVVALNRTRLAERASHRVSTYSGGMKQRLNLAIALLHDPPVLLLDEPTAALDPVSRDSLFADLETLRDEGRAILLTTHHLDEVETNCDRVAVLDRGKRIAYGTPAELGRPATQGRAILYAHLIDRLPRGAQLELQERIGETAEIEITGRRVRLAAETPDDLGRALAEVLAAGVPLESFRTPPGRLEQLLRGTAEPRRLRLHTSLTGIRE